MRSLSLRPFGTAASLLPSTSNAAIADKDVEPSGCLEARNLGEACTAPASHVGLVGACAPGSAGVRSAVGRREDVVPFEPVRERGLPSVSEPSCFSSKSARGPGAAAVGGGP